MRHNLAPDWLRSTLWAHRGLHDTAAPENSRAAFQQAITAGYGIELDIQQLIDGALVVFHDTDLKRLCNQAVAVNSLTSEEIQQCQLLNSGETIPLLLDVLDLVADRVPLLLEIKSWAWPGQLETRLLTHLAQYTGRVAVQSFNPLVVAWLARKAPYLCRGQLAGDFRTLIPRWLPVHLLSRLLLLDYGQPHFLAYEASALPNPHVARYKANGRPVLAWTVTCTAEQARVRDFADSVIFEGYAAI